MLACGANVYLRFDIVYEPKKVWWHRNQQNDGRAPVLQNAEVRRWMCPFQTGICKFTTQAYRATELRIAAFKE